MPIISSESGDPPPGHDAGAGKARRDLLLKVYDAAIAEYRFNVQLNWDRTKFYLGLVVSGIAAGVGLIKLSTETMSTAIFLTSYFSLLIAITIFGSQAVGRGKQYTRQAVLTKTLIERELDLFKQIGCFSDPKLHLGIAVTPGQRKFLGVIFDREIREDKKPDAGSVLSQTQWIFVVLVAIEIAGVVLTWTNFVFQADKALSP